MYEFIICIVICIGLVIYINSEEIIERRIPVYN
jgi:hypothetical protein